MGILRVFIVEDNPLIREVLYLSLKDIPDLEILGDASDAREAREKIMELSPDLLILDVELRGSENGFDLLHSIPPRERSFCVIFITGYQKYALPAAQASAVDFIIKPFQPGDIARAIAKIRQKNEILRRKYLSDTVLNVFRGMADSSRPERMILPVAGGFHIVETNKLLYCHSEHNHTSFYLADGQKLMVHRPIARYEELLKNNNFIEIARSFWINMDKVKSYSTPVEKDDGGNVTMINGAKVQISRRKKEQFLIAMEKFIRDSGS